MNESDLNRPNRWTWLSYAYAMLVVAGISYLLFDIPIQVSDSYGNLVAASGRTMGSLVYEQFHGRGFLRPFLWAHIRFVYDLSGGNYYMWFRGWHVGQVALLTLLFVRLVKPRTAAAAAAVTTGLAALIGLHTFAGTILEAFPINAYMTILICCYFAADLALSPPRWWRDVAAVVLFVFAALSVESGLLIAVVLVAAYLAGARGVSRWGIAVVVLLVAGYLALRFAVLDVGTPGLIERSSGFGFSVLEPKDLESRFGERPTVFYLYNIGTALLSVLFSEPRAGVWIAARNFLYGDELSIALVANLIASLLGTLVLMWYAWRRREDWIARRFTRDDQLMAIFVAVTLANAVISYPYTKDVILSPAGIFYAAAFTVAVKALVETAVISASRVRVATLTMFLVVLSGAWAFRAMAIHIALREVASVVRNDWVYIDDWIKNQGLHPDAAGLALKQRLQTDAILTHPARPAVIGDWVEWFREP
ncbi:MAG TPA: hypothetical protein VKA59_22205 [Vicinamibacterales bacterium]|nr:hypothetical protein [Vicinamibacterales bacterium]